MESNRCEKTIGVGVDLPVASPTVMPSPSDTCQHINGRGHRCHMLTTDPNSSLCPHHTRMQTRRERREQEAEAQELLRTVEDFSDAHAVNFFLGNLVKQLARKRIARRDAIAMAYISQLLLNSITVLERQSQAKKGDVSEFLLSHLLRKRDPDDPSNGTTQ